MRITQEMLMKVAQDAVLQRTRADRSIVAAYLYGSILLNSPLIGNTTDIDLFFIYDSEVVTEREIVRITDDVHLDIVNFPRRVFRQVRELRTHPWWGPTFYGCKILYDPQHFVDFIQASVRGQYERPDHVFARVRPLQEQARQIWFSFGVTGSKSDTDQVLHYLQALEFSANAIALLSGDPLTERRFLMDFPIRAAAIERPGLMAGLMGLLSASQLDIAALYAMIENWNMTFELAQKYTPPPDLSVNRRNYYTHAFNALVSGEHPLVSVWPLLHSWTRLTSLVPLDSPVHQVWQDTCGRMSLLGAGFTEKVDALDSFLDLVDETLELWAQKNGA